MNAIINFYGQNKLKAAGFDADAQAFFNAANITDTNEKDAVNDLVVDLKATNLWSEMYAIYPFVGQTSDSCKYNLKDPRDADDAYRLTYIGTNSFTNLGLSQSGTSGADSKFILANAGVTSSLACGVYFNNNANGSIATTLGAQPSSVFSALAVIQHYPNFGSVSGQGTCDPFSENPSRITFTAVDQKGLQFWDRTSNTFAAVYKNTTELGSTTADVTASPRNDRSLYIGCRNSGTADVFGNNVISFAFISKKIGASNITSFYNAVDKFATALGRNV